MTTCELPKPTLVSRLSPGKFADVVFAVVFLQSLLIAWLLFLMTGATGEMMPLFRLVMGIAILFAILFPVFILLEGFRYSSILAGFFIPLVLYTLMFPLFNSLVSRMNLFLDPMVIIPAFIGGIGFGLIGLGAYHSRRGILRTFALVTAGLTIIFLSSPTILSVFLFVITGNVPSFPLFLR
jgi:hypothetical protein